MLIINKLKNTIICLILKINLKTMVRFNYFKVAYKSK